MTHSNANPEQNQPAATGQRKDSANSGSKKNRATPTSNPALNGTTYREIRCTLVNRTPTAALRTAIAVIQTERDIGEAVTMLAAEALASTVARQAPRALERRYFSTRKFPTKRASIPEE